MVECKDCVHNKVCAEVNSLKCRKDFIWYDAKYGCPYYSADFVPKSEVENIFAEIETCMKDFEDDDDGYLLKKCEFEFFMREIKEKYAGQKNG